MTHDVGVVVDDPCGAWFGLASVQRFGCRAAARRAKFATFRGVPHWPCIYIYIYICMCVYIYIHIHISNILLPNLRTKPFADAAAVAGQQRSDPNPTISMPEIASPHSQARVYT